MLVAEIRIAPRQSPIHISAVLGAIVAERGEFFRVDIQRINVGSEEPIELVGPALWDESGWGGGWGR